MQWICRFSYLWMFQVLRWDFNTATLGGGGSHEKHTHTQVHTHTRLNKTHTLSAASHEVSQCCCEASIQLLAFQQHVQNKKKKKDTYKQHRYKCSGAMTFKCSRQVYETNWTFSESSCNSHELLSCLKSSSSNSNGSCSVVATISKALAPAVTPYEHWGRTRLRIFCAIKLPAFISHAIQFHCFKIMTEKIKEQEQADDDREQI